MEDNCTEYRNLGWWFISLNTSLPFCLHDLSEEKSVRCNFYLCSSVSKVFSPLASFRILSLIFCSLKMICLGVVFLVLCPVWCSLSFLDPQFNLGKFSIITVWDISSLSFSLSSPGIPITHAPTFIAGPQPLGRHCVFFSLFSLCFSIWGVFIETASSSGSLSSAVSSQVTSPTKELSVFITFWVLTSSLHCSEPSESLLCSVTHLCKELPFPISLTNMS